MLIARHSKHWRFLEAEISSLIVRASVVDFKIGNCQATVERTPTTAKFREGDRLRVLLQEPMEDSFFHVHAFQRARERTIHYTGPRMAIHVTVIGAMLFALGLYSGLSFVLVTATSLFALEVLFSLGQIGALRRFRVP